MEWLTIATRIAIVAIDAMALIVIVIGTIEAFVGSIKLAFATTTGAERRHLWLGYSRWLVAGLTFQLAADVIETSIAPSWEDIGRLGAVAVIRTFLNFFLERDLLEVRKLQHPRVADSPKSF